MACWPLKSVSTGAASAPGTPNCVSAGPAARTRICLLAPGAMVKAGMSTPPPVPTAARAERLSRRLAGDGVASAVIHAESSDSAARSRSLDASGGMRVAKTPVTRRSMTEWTASPGTITRSSGTTAATESGPLTMPASESGVAARASHAPCAVPPGWWHCAQLASR